MQQEEKEQKGSKSCCLYIITLLGNCCIWIYDKVARCCRCIYDVIAWCCRVMWYFLSCQLCCKKKKQKNSDSDEQGENPNYYSQEEIIRYSTKANYPRKLGIPNYGNTCYLNSVLQILASTPGFSNCLNPNSELSGTLLGIINMINRNSEANFKPKIDNFLQIIYQTYSNFTLGRQNDSKEIFTIIIDKCAEINKGLKELFFIRKDKNFICGKGHKEEKLEEDTFLVVPGRFDRDISDFINISEERSDFIGDNKLYCNTCDALKDTHVYTEYKLPKILAVYFSSENPRKRNIKDTEKFKGEVYELYGVICFYLSYRHYVAYTLDGEIWREYNDMSVSDKKPDYNYIYMAFYRHAVKLEMIK